MTQPLLIEHDDGVDRVTLNRPDSLNALNPEMIDALNAYFEGLQRNRSTRVVVLKGAGASFCAGLDLKHAMARRAGQQEPPGVTESLDSQRRIADIVLLMRRCESSDSVTPGGSCCPARRFMACLRSSPAQNEAPAPLSTTTRVERLRCRLSK